MATGSLFVGFGLVTGCAHSCCIKAGLWTRQSSLLSVWQFGWCQGHAWLPAWTHSQPSVEASRPKRMCKSCLQCSGNFGKEKASWSQDRKRSYGCTLIPWSGGKSLAWDVTVCTTAANSYLTTASHAAGTVWKCTFRSQSCVGSTMKHDAADDLSNLVLWYGYSRERRYSGAEVVWTNSSQPLAAGDFDRLMLLPATFHEPAHSHNSGRSILHRCWSTSVEQSTTSSSWLWTIAFRVSPVTENAFVWLKIAAPSDLLLDVVCLTNVLTYLLT